MKQTRNSKVPFAILSCFTIAFILQGVLKLCGVFIFEKALNWEIFALIDNNKFLSIIYYSILVLIAMYCLSFTLNRKPYSRKWYHYVILIFFAFGSTTLKFYTNTAMTTESSIVIDMLYDVVLYIIVPLIIHFTSGKETRLFKQYTVTKVVLIIMVQILLYFLYLGLNYWSAFISSIIPSLQYVAYASSALLIQLEVYIGVFNLMLTMNMLIQNFVKEEDMIKPINIATDEAKEKELKKVKEQKAKKNNGK